MPLISPRAVQDERELKSNKQIKWRKWSRQTRCVEWDAWARLRRYVAAVTKIKHRNQDWASFCCSSVTSVVSQGAEKQRAFTLLNNLDAPQSPLWPHSRGSSYLRTTRLGTDPAAACGRCRCPGGCGPAPPAHPRSTSPTTCFLTSGLPAAWQPSGRRDRRVMRSSFCYEVILWSCSQPHTSMTWSAHTHTHTHRRSDAQTRRGGNRFRTTLKGWVTQWAQQQAQPNADV